MHCSLLMSLGRRGYQRAKDAEIVISIQGSDNVCTMTDGQYVTLTRDDFEVVFKALESYTCSITMDNIQETMLLLEDAWDVLQDYK